MEASRSLFSKRQVGALCWRHKGRLKELQVLLVTSRETRRWVIPKGWTMDNLVDYNAARREAFEEAGVIGHMRRTPIGSYDYDKRKRNGELVLTRVDVYAMEVINAKQSWPEKGERRREWFSPADAAQCVEEPELKILLKNFLP